jgi:hypothetical protein
MHRHEDAKNGERLAGLIRQHVGQVDDLCVDVDGRGLVLRGHAHTGLARVLVEVEAAGLSGLPVIENRITVIERAARRRASESASAPDRVAPASDTGFGR